MVKENNFDNMKHQLTAFMGYKGVSCSQMLLVISRCADLCINIHFDNLLVWSIEGFDNTMPRGKEMSTGLGETIVVAPKSGQGYKTISKQFEGNIVQ